MNTEIIKSLEGNLLKYQADVEMITSKEDSEELMRIVKTAKSLIEALKNKNIDKVKNKALGFSRNVSDAYCSQPESFKSLAEDVRRVKLLIK